MSTSSFVMLIVNKNEVVNPAGFELKSISVTCTTSTPLQERQLAIYENTHNIDDLPSSCNVESNPVSSITILILAIILLGIVKLVSTYKNISVLDNTIVVNNGNAFLPRAKIFNLRNENYVLTLVLRTQIKKLFGIMPYPVVAVVFESNEG